MRPVLVSLHAHPDDEAIFTGGTIAAAVRVTAGGWCWWWRPKVTSGHVRRPAARSGPIGGPRRWPRRRSWASSASSSSATATRVTCLRWDPSGSSAARGRDLRSGTLAAAFVDGAARRVRAILVEEDAAALTSYDANGVYGHIDHVQVHEIATRSVEGTDCALVEATIGRAALRLLRADLLGRGLVSDLWPVGPGRTDRRRGRSRPDVRRRDGPPPDQADRGGRPFESGGGSGDVHGTAGRCLPPPVGHGVVPCRPTGRRSPASACSIPSAGPVLHRRPPSGPTPASSPPPPDPIVPAAPPPAGTLWAMTRDPGDRADGWVIAGLCLLTTATGALDATSFLDLGRTFTANMTGNVLLLAFSLTGTSLGGGSSSRGFAVALVAFVVGALVGATVAGRRGRAARLPAALAVEVVLVAIALGLTASGPAHEAWRPDVVVALLALAMGVQNAMVRRMSVPEANTTVLTTSLGSLAADVVAVGGRPPRAGRRVGTVACIFGGAAVGAELQRHGPSWSLLLALVLVGLSAVALGRAGWPAPVDRSARSPLSPPA